jgi:hypothetical protein
MRRALFWFAIVAAAAAGATVAVLPQPGTAGGVACVPRWRVIAHGFRVPALYDVAALSPTDVWAVGSRGGYKEGSKPLAVHWDGRSQRIMQPFTPSSRHGELNGVVAISSNDVWAVGTDGWDLGHPVIVHWDGHSWTVVPTPSLTFMGALWGIAAFGHDDVWVVGQLGRSSDPAQPPLLMHWNGQAWTIVDLSDVAPRGSGLDAIAGTSGDDVWAVGGQGLLGTERDNAGLVLHWDGQAWTQPAGFPGLYDGTVGAIDVASPTEVWMVKNASLEGYPDYIVHRKWPRGAKVVYTDPAHDAYALTDIAAVSQKSAWVVGWRLSFDYEHAHPLFVHWNGRSWRRHRTALDRLNVGLSSLSVVSGREIWAAGWGYSSTGNNGTGLLARYSC